MAFEGDPDLALNEADDAVTFVARDRQSLHQGAPKLAQQRRVGSGQPAMDARTMNAMKRCHLLERQLLGELIEKQISFAAAQAAHCIRERVLKLVAVESLD